MKQISCIVIYLFLSVTGFAQKQDRVWIFGDHAGIDFNDTANPISFYSGLAGYYSAYPFGSISDARGSLLFYTAGVRLAVLGVSIFNRQDSLMLNGDSLEGHPVFAQGILILPFPGDSMKYYVFTKNQHTSKILFYYSVVDMTLDNGLGGVVNKNTLIPCDSLTDRTTAVKHANGRDWWLIVQRWDQDEYLKFLITPSGILGPFRQPTNNNLPKQMYYGTSYFSRSGNKLVSVGEFGSIDLMDFDRCTGNISNYLRIGENIFSPENSYFGCAFSENENVLYVGNIYPSPGKYVYQFDLTAPNISASKQVINMYPDTGQLLYIQYGHMLLAPDNKIYIAKGNGSGPNSNTIYTHNMDVILNPDVVGSGCNYMSNYFSLGNGRTTYGLPNMVNYSLGPVVGSICDSLNTGIQLRPVSNNPFTISPNPARNWINIYQKNDFANGKAYHILLLNSQGQVVLEKEMKAGEYSIPVSTISSGVYTLRVITREVVFSEKVEKADR